MAAAEITETGVCSTPADARPADNQDSAFCASEHGVAGVFDGVGGYSGGAIAAAAARRAFLDALAVLPSAHTPQDPAGRRSRWLAETTLSAAEAIRASQQQHSDAATQGSTVAAAVITGTTAAVVSVGDSRVYLLSRDGLRQLTVDDAWEFPGMTAEQLADAWAMIDDAASSRDLRLREHQIMWRRRNLITLDLGLLSWLPDVRTVPVSCGDRLLLTTDGVHDNLTRTELAAIAEHHRAGDTDRFAEAVVAAARARARSPHFRAKDDDITAAVLTVE